MHTPKHLIIVSAVLALMTFSCQKNSDSAPAADTTVTPVTDTVKKASVVNSTNSPVVAVSDSVYAVMPSPKEIKGISLANKPIKSLCKAINTMSAEVAALEAQKVKAIDMVETDNSAEGAVDEIASSIEQKNAEIAAAKAKTFKVAMTYTKEQMLKNLEQIKKDNAGVSIVLGQPENLKLAVMDKEEVKATQSVVTKDSLVEGAFDETASDIKMNFEVNYDVLCSMRANKDSKLVLNFK